jgi:acyl-CoA synthetase (AMP-forming)/AMP-acid ligase II
VIPDLMPVGLRTEWSQHGYYNDRDLYQHFAAVAARAPATIAVIDESGATTYGELRSAGHRLAHLLDSEGIGVGDIVAVQLENRWEACAVEIAIVAVGAVCLPYPVEAGPDDFVRLLTRSATSMAIVADLAAVDAVRRARLPALRSVLGLEGDGSSSLQLELSGGDSRWTPRPIDAGSACRIIVTSGTESAPKLIAYSHNALGEPQAAMNRRYDPREGWRTFVMVPLASGMGSRATFHFMADYGGSIILISRFEPGAVLARIERDRPTHLYVVPTMLQMMIRHPAFLTSDLSSVEVVAVAGASMSPAVYRQIADTTGWVIVPSWGCTDGGQVGADATDDRDKLLYTVGKPAPAVSTIRIVDELGHDQPSCREGEIWARGPFTPMCYLKAPELDRRYRTTDGWVKTGDQGLLDGDGYLCVTGRRKDVILRGGLNISPAEVEGHLAAHSDIVQVACVSVPDDLVGERMCAVVTVRKGAVVPTLEDLLKFLNARGVSKRKWPEYLIILDAMPMNPAGKLLKRRLREEAGRAIQRAVD